VESGVGLHGEVVRWIETKCDGIGVQHLQGKIRRMEENPAVILTSTSPFKKC
jgi:hypothetical protein